jgi:small subunit ribosomal protein S30e
MQLFVHGVSLHTLELNGSETVGHVISMVAEKEGMASEEVVMYSAGSPLENDALLSACAPELSTLELEVRLRGGKVHGSLARAGKVKGQTPKVEKGEKKKKKTGRAKRRMQYNRRFVNVVAQFGRKKGPNSNS